MKNKRVIVIAGATASGKTDLGVAVALATGGEIVSADSMQIYRGMDIGTAKASADEQKLVRHHMIDEYDIVLFIKCQRQCFITTGGRIDLYSRLFEQVSEHVEINRGIIYHQYFRLGSMEFFMIFP